MGEFFKANEEAIVTRNAYMIFVTEDSSGVKKTVNVPASVIKTNTADSVLKKPGCRVKIPWQKRWMS
ncbi:hypothetical protein [Mucilaginibacter antarcticus]|uniref:hypothetical protein n=1 Tax=Mucilaginibacter antarcticus TaxID=1855725 RepID=UPI003630D0A6